MKAMRAALILTAPRPDEFSVRIKDHHGVINLRTPADGVLDVDVALQIHGHAVRIAVNMAGWQFAPIVDDFVLVIALAQHRRPVSRFIIGQDKRRGECDGGQSTRLFEKFPTAQEWLFHNGVLAIDFARRFQVFQAIL